MSLLASLRKRRADRFATATPATSATLEGEMGRTVASVATVAVASKQKLAANDPAPNPDRWCWPRSTAMNTVEIDTFTARLARFTDKGLPLTHAEKLADRLVTRDRERDNRRLCLECAHLAWSGHCSNWRAAGAAIRVGNARVPVVLFDQLQHCAGFNAAIASATTSPLLRNERQKVRPDDQN